MFPSLVSRSNTRSLEALRAAARVLHSARALPTVSLTSSHRAAVTPASWEAVVACLKRSTLSLNDASVSDIAADAWTSCCRRSCSCCANSLSELASLSRIRSRRETSSLYVFSALARTRCASSTVISTDDVNISSARLAVSGDASASSPAMPSCVCTSTDTMSSRAQYRGPEPQNRGLSSLAGFVPFVADLSALRARDMRTPDVCSSISSMAVWNPTWSKLRG
mmetsp:Transcript_53094/g.124104  ORF Transcript_53094/g.124104 Transcript_53094/m.124104 type:complete len:223 (-) Transcript_53094:33-701(-)